MFVQGVSEGNQDTMSALCSTCFSGEVGAREPQRVTVLSILVLKKYCITATTNTAIEEKKKKNSPVFSAVREIDGS